MPSPRFVSKLSPEQWAEARRLRAEGATYPIIARRFGVNPSTINTRARTEGWTAAGKAAADAERKAAQRKSSPSTIETRRRLAPRLYKIIEVRMKKLELSMQKQLQKLERDPDAVVSSAATKDEHDAFAALIKDINQVTEMASEPASAADGRRTKSASVNPELTALSDDIDPNGLAIASEKDNLRADLAERLGKLFPKR